MEINITTHERESPDHRGGYPGIRGFIQRNPLVSFFVLALGLSWIAWTPYVVSMNGLGLEPTRFPDVMGTGTGQILGVLPGAYLGPLGAAFTVTSIVGGKAGLRRWAGRIFKWKIKWTWYPGLILGVPLILILCTLPFTGGRLALPPAQALLMYLPFLVFQIITTGLAEEPGWRDFALPYMQPKFGPLGGTLILGPLWGAWHLPLFLTDWAGPKVTWLTPVEFIVSCIGISVAMTWVFNKTGESLPAALIAHTSINNFHSLIWPAMFLSYTGRETSDHMQLISAAVVAIVLIIATRGRLGYPRPATVVPPESPTGPPNQQSGPPIQQAGHPS